MRLLDAVTQFLLALAARAPTVLVLDDLHWADAGTVTLLRHVARFAPRGRLLVLGAYRDVEVDAAASAGRRARHAAAGDELRAARARRARRGRGAGAAGDGRRRTRCPRRWSTALTRETSGNPFFIREVLLHLVEEGTLARDGGRWTATRRARGAAAARDGAAGDRAAARAPVGRRRRLLRVAAAFTGGIDFEVARRVAGLEEAAALDALDEALAAQLLVPTAGPHAYDFTHALVRHTLYEALSPARQVRLHRRDRGGDGGGVRRARRPSTRRRSRGTTIAARSLPGAERGVPYCLAAADQAERAAAFAHAAEHLRAALDLLPRNAPERPRLSARLGLALVCAQRFDDAIGVAREAADLIAETEGPDAAADYLAEVVTELNEVGGSFAVHRPLVRQGLEYAGERRDQHLGGPEGVPARRRDRFIWDSSLNLSTRPSVGRSRPCRERSGREISLRYFPPRGPRFWRESRHRMALRGGRVPAAGYRCSARSPNGRSDLGRLAGRAGP